MILTQLELNLIIIIILLITIIIVSLRNHNFHVIKIRKLNNELYMEKWENDILKRKLEDNKKSLTN